MSPRARYLVSPAYDWAFFLSPPLVSLLLGVLIAGTTFSERRFTLLGQERTAAKLAIGALVHAHLVAVLLRSHGDPAIRRRHPLRFWLVPPLLFAGIRGSAWFALTAAVVAGWWDVWHSGAQTFGFGRIYDRNAGNPPALGRRLDFWLNQLLYAGPILGGATLLDHLAQLQGYQELGSALFTAVPLYARGWQRGLALGVLGVGTLFLCGYLYGYLRLWRAGYRPSPLKLFLLVSTGACSIYTWGLNSFGQAFFIMNLFHAVQYLGLVWALERGTLQRRLGAAPRPLVLLVFLLAVLGYGLAAELCTMRQETLWSLTLVVSLLHFWYDGFVWSVRERQV